MDRKYVQSVELKQFMRSGRGWLMISKFLHTKAAFDVYCESQRFLYGFKNKRIATEFFKQTLYNGPSSSKKYNHLSHGPRAGDPEIQKLLIHPDLLAKKVKNEPMVVAWKEAAMRFSEDYRADVADFLSKDIEA